MRALCCHCREKIISENKVLALVAVGLSVMLVVVVYGLVRLAVIL